MSPARFERWLALWAQTTDELCPPALAATMQARAAQIAVSLQHALEPLRTRASRTRLPVVQAAPPLPVPYKSTPIFDETSLPRALRRAHKTKAGVWGVIRVLEGQARLHVDGEAAPRELDADHPATVAPTQLHHVEPVGAMRLQVDFYDVPPVLPAPRDA
jgi:hemoglobin